MVEFDRRSIPLTVEQWQNLERLAAEFKTTPPSGPTFGKPSWRSLMKAIANNEILLYRKPVDPQDPALGQDSE